MSFTTLKVASVCALAGGVAVFAACSSDDPSTTTGSTASANTAAAVTGAADTHCGSTVVTVEEAACTATEDQDHHATDAGETATEDAGDAGDAGATTEDAGTTDEDGTSEYGPTRYNAESDDDDCKYHVAWKATPVTVNGDVSFVVTLTSKADGSAVTGANVRAELFLDTTHPAPNTSVKTTESAGGTYTIGPVRFDAAGQWTTRFHFFETCNDNEHSPHGHAAFYVKVP